MTSAKAGAYFIFYAEKELGTLGALEFRVCCVPSSLTRSCLALSQAACAQRENCVFARAGSGEPWACGQLPGALWSLCMSGWEALPVCGRRGYHVPWAQSPLPLNHRHRPQSTCCLGGLCSADLDLPTWSHSTTLSQVCMWEFKRSSNVPLKMFPGNSVISEWTLDTGVQGSEEGVDPTRWAHCH